MPYVGYSGVADLANTSDGFALGVGAKNIVGESIAGADVGDGGVVDLYGGAAVSKFYIADESDPGYVLQEDDSKIVLEAS
jgi:hypothetical protein